MVYVPFFERILITYNGWVRGVVLVFRFKV